MSETALKEYSETDSLEENVFHVENDADVSGNFEHCVWKAMHRTPEEIAEARRQLEPYFIPPRPLPLGKTLEEVFVGAVKEEDGGKTIRPFQKVSA